MGKRTHLVVDNKPVPWSQTHEAFRNHLQDVQWAQRQRPDHSAAYLDSLPPLHPTLADAPPFTIEELQDALRRMKKNKAPGPDGIHAEMLMLLDATNEQILLDY